MLREFLEFLVGGLVIGVLAVVGWALVGALVGVAIGVSELVLQMLR